MAGVSDESGRGPVVVGVDGSAGAREALVWAMAEATRWDAPLRVVSAFPVEVYWADPHLLDQQGIDAVRDDTDARVRALVDEVASGVADRPAAMDVAVRPGPATRQLLAAAEDADLLVVGSRGRGSVRSTLLGSVALHTVTHARCPVVVVHPRADAVGRTARRVVVGLDGSDGSRVALAEAVTEAGRLGAEVTAVAAWSARNYWSDAYDVLLTHRDRLREEARRGAEAIVAEVGARVPIRTLAVEGPAGEVLVREAESAALLVVGGRGRGAVRGVLLGSVALHCVIHAACPVMVVRSDRSGERPA